MQTNMQNSFVLGKVTQHIISEKSGIVMSEEQK